MQLPKLSLKSRSLELNAKAFSICCFTMAGANTVTFLLGLYNTISGNYDVTGCTFLNIIAYLFSFAIIMTGFITGINAKQDIEKVLKHFKIYLYISVASYVREIISTISYFYTDKSYFSQMGIETFGEYLEFYAFVILEYALVAILSFILAQTVKKANWFQILRIVFLTIEIYRIYSSLYSIYLLITYNYYLTGISSGVWIISRTAFVLLLFIGLRLELPIEERLKRLNDKYISGKISREEFERKTINLLKIK